MPLLPEKFQAQMEQQLGEDCAPFVKALKDVSPTSIRINPQKKHPSINESVPWCKTGYYLNERPVFTLDPLFHAGTYYVQEASSMFLEQAMSLTDFSKPLKVLDLCAAPGGKSTHLLSLLNENSLLVSNEVIRSRSSILSENIQKWGLGNVIVTNNDPADFAKLEGFFDVIVIDAPCSGEGLFRKDKEAAEEWSMENVALCSARQKRIVHDAWPALKENGLLIYCTCTYNPQENEKNLNQLSKALSFEFIDIPIQSTWNINKITYHNVIGYRFYPHKVKGEGFFLSAMIKKETSHIISTKSRKKISIASKKVSDTLATWITQPERYTFIQHNELVFAFPGNYQQDLEFLLQHLKVVYAGVNLTTIKHDKYIPEHALALSPIINQENFRAIEVSHAEALQYLRRESLNLNHEGKGYALFTYEDVPLGWVNLLQNRVNNMYPQEWRIRMNSVS